MLRGEHRCSTAASSGGAAARQHCKRRGAAVGAALLHGGVDLKPSVEETHARAHRARSRFSDAQRLLSATGTAAFGLRLVVRVGAHARRRRRPAATRFAQRRRHAHMSLLRLSSARASAGVAGHCPRKRWCVAIPGGEGGGHPSPARSFARVRCGVAHDELQLRAATTTRCTPHARRCSSLALNQARRPPRPLVGGLKRPATAEGPPSPGPISSESHPRARAPLRVESGHIMYRGRHVATRCRTCAPRFGACAAQSPAQE